MVFSYPEDCLNYIFALTSLNNHKKVSDHCSTPILSISRRGSCHVYTARSAKHSTEINHSQKYRKYSINSPLSFKNIGNDISTNDMNPYHLTGFIDGLRSMGCFNLTIYKNKELTVG